MNGLSLWLALFLVATPPKKEVPSPLASGSPEQSIWRQLLFPEPPPLSAAFVSPRQAAQWLVQAAKKIKSRIPDLEDRLYFLRHLHYEARRAGLDPDLVLSVVEVESDFQRYAVSTAGARGYMQVMPFWTNLMGRPQDNLFETQTNLRYGCTILAYYLEIEHQNLPRALARYNGSLGRDVYPNAVLARLRQHWQGTQEVASR